MQEFDWKIKEFMKGNAIEFYIVICRSSDPSSSSYDMFVEEKNKAKVAEFTTSLVNSDSEK